MQIPPFLLDQWLNYYHFSEQPPEFDFASSTGPHWTLRDILGLIDDDEKELLLNTELTYSAATGSEKLRQAISEMQGSRPEHVQVVTGASEALLVLFARAAQKGANVVLPSPLFPSTAVIAQLFGLEIRYYKLRPENEFKADLDEIKKLTDNQSALVLVNTPHNPTGATLSNEELRELHDFAVSRGIQFVSDEVYHQIYHGAETESAAVLPQATVLGSFSKSLALSGLRVGWIIERDESKLQQYTDARGYFTISNPPLAEKFAIVALRNREIILERTRRVAANNLKLLDKFFAEHADDLGWVRPRGGLTIFPWLKHEKDARPFCRDLAARGVLFAPGDCFAMPNHFRLGFGVAEEGFAEGLSRVGEFLKTRTLRAAHKEA